MAGLKAIVIIMGVLIVGGFIVIAVTIFNRATAPRGEAALTVPVPPGGAIDMTAADDRIVLRYRLANGQEQLVLINARTGKPAGTITLVPTP
jgi:hypothetical protein